ncbi:cysteine proteinase [Dendrothele bispora CBS 962.96]|uniref:ubiquitinyl hydrolase 1 n=1 Tax=Dendrothele bispora (strain CBS 962.96) TaxID=1314807 RepID=A0A4S8KUL5_DENBC|nr:cysteine proteinase [Dendrothele bispora CBS 962.96]
MTSPRPHYAQQGPGPSNYYSPQTPPPTHFNYSPNHAGPSNGYPYQYPVPPPHMTPYPQQTHSPRMNGRGGYHLQNRGGHGYQQNYHTHQAYVPMPYAQHPKYPHGHGQNFSPPAYPYHHPAPGPGPYSPSPSWQTHQPHMFPSYDNGNEYAPPMEMDSTPQQQPMTNPPADILSEPSSSVIKQESPVPSRRSPVTSEKSMPPVIDEAPPPPPIENVAAAPSTTDDSTNSNVPEPYASSPLASSTTDDSTNSNVPEPHTSSPLAPSTTDDPNVPEPYASSPLPSPTALPTSTSASVSTSTPTFTLAPFTPSQASGHTKWVIWSRRPTNPSNAPGLIFSKNSRPPAHIVEDALPDKTPPASPVLESKKALPGETSKRAKKSKPKENGNEGEDKAKGQVQDASSSPVEVVAGPEDATAPSSAPHSQTTSTVPSSSATAATDTPTLPGSPASSNTSISVVGGSTPSQVLKDNDTTEQISEGSTQTGSAPGTTTATAPAATSQEIVTAPSSTASTPAAAPATPPVKKSWASLLKPSPSSPSSSPSPSTSAAGPTKNALPISSVVGFSIPADQPPSSGLVGSAKGIPGVSSAKRVALLALLNGEAQAQTQTSPTLTSFAAAAASQPAPSSSSSSADLLKIRPRGLINTGNMCFANSVLQVLLYCPPFFKLFYELGRLLPGTVIGEDPVVGQVAANDGLKVSLVKATVQFLRDFLPGEKEKEKEKERGGKGKGKEREREREEDDWERESFIPTYVYDAMKEKKRFDGMRGGHQEDAEEFFGFYLETLEEELLAIQNALTPPPPPPPSSHHGKGGQNKAGSVQTSSSTTAVEEKEEEEPPEDDGWLEVGKRNRMVVTRTIKSTESPITRIFGGKFRSTLKAAGQKDSATVEDWRSLKLDIQPDTIHTIQDAILYHARPSPIQLTLPSTHPTRPNQSIEASQQVLIDSLPSILVIHLKRFCYDVQVGGVVKVGKRVSFGEEVVIGSDVMSPLAKKPHNARYKLFGAIYHHGLSASGGHYTLDVLHPNRFPASAPNANAQASAKLKEGWIRIDDELVSDVMHEDVFGEGQEKDETRCAYLLFYRRVK